MIESAVDFDAAPHASPRSAGDNRFVASETSSFFKRCAIYTRKSSEEGLEQDFNSLDAQKEACVAFIQSQRHEGWRLLRPSHGEATNHYDYDDGGLSGGTMDRPGLKRLLSAIECGQIDVVVVYKVDRLTRSLADFARIVDVFDRHDVSFVSVTQAFNTTSSMGRLTLNVLLSFAQFEREVTAERIRDKIAASKRKGIWMGGRVPLGYRVENRKLLTHDAEAQTVQLIFKTYAKTQSLPKTKAFLDEAGLTTRAPRASSKHDDPVEGDEGHSKRSFNPSSSGNRFSCGGLSTLLRNPIYRGKLTHKGAVYEGEHEALVDEDLFERVQALLGSAKGGNHKRRSSSVTIRTGRLLKGLLFDSAGFAMTTTHSSRKGVVRNYYLSTALAKNRKSEAGWPHRVPAAKLEDTVLTALSLHTTKASSRASYDHSATRSTSASRPVDVEYLLKLVRRIDLTADGAKVTLNSVGVDDVHDQLLLTVDWKRPTRRGCINPSREQARQERQLARDAHNRSKLLTAIARAHVWYEELKSGGVASITELAAREKRSVRSIRLNLNLAWLAPDLVRAALNGQLDPKLSATELARSLPSDWETQRTLIGHRSNRPEVFV